MCRARVRAVGGTQRTGLGAGRRREEEEEEEPMLPPGPQGTENPCSISYSAYDLLLEMEESRALFLLVFSCVSHGGSATATGVPVRAYISMADAAARPAIFLQIKSM